MGRAMALAFARAGADISIGSLLAAKENMKVGGELSFLPGRDELQAARGEIERLGVRCLALGLDVTETESVQAFCDTTIAELGKIDILANAAGITAEHAISGHSEALWRKVMSVNVDGAFRTIRLALPGMIERKWGRIINIGSEVFHLGVKPFTAYVAAKGGQNGFNRSLAHELAEWNITVNMVAPGWIPVERHENDPQELKDGYLASIPMGRWGVPQDLDGTVVYLASEASGFVTGQNIHVNGGTTVH